MRIAITYSKQEAMAIVELDREAVLASTGGGYVVSWSFTKMLNDGPGGDYRLVTSDDIPDGILFTRRDDPLVSIIENMLNN